MPRRKRKPRKEYDDKYNTSDKGKARRARYEAKHPERGFRLRHKKPPGGSY